MSTTAQTQSTPERTVDLDGPAIAHIGHRVGDQVAFCGAPIIGVRCTDGRPVCGDCERIAAAGRREQG
jgi:hypothetical protein